MSSEQKLDLNQLRSDVEREIHNEKHGKIAKICRTVLASKPTELLWLRLLCCSMVHLSETKSLLKLIESYSNNHEVQSALLFYKIYCLYLLKQNKEALQLLKQQQDRIKLAEERVAMKYLQYQMLYRLAKYDAALKVLSQISDNEHLAQLAVNEISTLIAMDRAQDAVNKYYNQTKYESLYNQCDFVFNLANALILCSKTQDAKSFLLTSITKCTKTMKDEEEEEDDVIASEIAHLELLVAYCLFMEGDIKNASVYYQRIRDKKQIDGIYHNLILENNCLAVEYENIVDMKQYYADHKEAASANLLLFKKLLCSKNDDNFSRFGASSMELMKAYCNKCIVLIQNPAQSQNRNDLAFKDLLAKIKKNTSPLCELPVFLKISYHLRFAQYQQICDILAHYLSTNEESASIKCRLLFIQILIDTEKYRRAIQQIAALKDNQVKYNAKTIRIALNLCDKLNDKQLKVEFIKECIQFLEEKQTNGELLISLQMDLCQLLLSMKEREQAKESALRLYKMDSSNDVYKAMLLLAAIETNDIELANKVSSEMKSDAIEYDAYEVEELLVEIPNINNTDDDDEGFEFEITQEIVTQRKRDANRRKRRKNAMKLRQKYKENPDLYREAVDWQSKKDKKRKEKSNKKIQKKKNRSGKKEKNSPKQKKKKGAKFRGAQGGINSQQGDKFQVFDAGDPRNKKAKSGKTVIPQHIKKRKKRS